ncbi:malonyl-CoA decarboxylase, mitochondrial isoform X2 [Vigna unguiculata]|uniref:malonyl-CoA decarboxylase, mitochondrial isoform X2 n=1 Tax=Vigna unguiculata TaxID=3917 RepID=UPI001017112F|nr:malonyl-CoA decarboxylase, mitochondrial isoform X2 [Vigna unguiculata]
MCKKAWSILMRARMKPNDRTNLSLSPIPLANATSQTQQQSSRQNGSPGEGNALPNDSGNSEREFKRVRSSMHSAISMNKTEVLDDVLNNFSEGYFSLSHENRRKLLLVLAREYDLNRSQVRDLIKQYLGLEPPADKTQVSGSEDEGLFSPFYRIERNLRHALQPVYEVLFERLNTHPGGLRILSILREDILTILAEENIASLRALDSYLKEKFVTWLSPAALELHQITWDDPASLLEKIVAYEAVHPISNLLDLKRRLGVGRRCFGYLHPAIPGEPLIFIEVALLKDVAQTIQEVLWDSPPIPESEATCALFYSISSTQPGLAGINLGKFLIKRVVTQVKREMPHISTFATLSPIPGFMSWLLSKLAASQTPLAEGGNLSQSQAEESSSTFYENILEPEEEESLMSLSKDIASGKNGMDLMFNLLTSTSSKWIHSPEIRSALKAPLMRLCARYLLKEKKRGKALDSVANFHLQNGAMVERINWMADRSEKGLSQSGGIMVNYVYRLDHIEEYAHSYFSNGEIHASSDLHRYVDEADTA